MAGGHAWQGGVHGRGACMVGACMVGCVCVWQGACMAGGGMHGRGCAWQGVCMAEGHAWQDGCAWWGGGAGYVAGDTATAEDSTHPTGMHSSLQVYSHCRKRIRVRGKLTWTVKYFRSKFAFAFKFGLCEYTNLILKPNHGVKQWLQNIFLISETCLISAQFI